MEGVDFIVFYAVQSIYITGNVIAEQKYLNTLKVTEDHIQLFRNRCDCIVITKSMLYTLVITGLYRSMCTVKRMLVLPCTLLELMQLDSFICHLYHLKRR